MHEYIGSSARLLDRYARVAGVLMFVSMVFGYFGEAYVPSKMLMSVAGVALMLWFLIKSVLTNEASSIAPAAEFRDGVLRMAAGARDA